MAKDKRYIVKIYDQDGTTIQRTLTTEAPADSTAMFVRNVPTFSSKINGGLGECVLDIHAPFDNFSEGTVVEFMNCLTIDAVVIDTELKTQTTTRIYKGYVSQYTPYLEGGSEGVKVTCLGLVSLLSRSYYKNGSNFTVTHSSQDPTVIGKAIVDHFLTIYSGSLLSYDASSIPATVGSNASITFTDQRWIEAITKVGELSGTGWWWRIGEDGKYYLQAKPSTPTHRLTVGENIVSFSFTKDSEKVINDVQVRRSGGTTSDYSDATSQSTYGTGSPATGKSSEIISDTSLTDVGAANLRGQKEIADFKDAKISATVTVNSKYNIESIHVGDTCSINNFRLANTFFGTNNLLIAGVSYEGESVTLELERINSSFGAELAAFVG